MLFAEGVVSCRSQQNDANDAQYPQYRQFGTEGTVGTEGTKHGIAPSIGPVEWRPSRHGMDDDWARLIAMAASATGKAKRRRKKIDSKPDCDGKSPWLDHLRDANQGALPEIRLCVFVNPV